MTFAVFIELLRDWTDDFARADIHASATARAKRGVYFGEVILHLDCAHRAFFLTNAAADTTDGASKTGCLSLLL